MAINVNQALNIRAPVSETAAAPRGSPRSVSPPATRTDLGTHGAAALQAAIAAEPGAHPAEAAREIDAASLDKAVEQANAIAEATLRATNRSVEFSRDRDSGRVTITITEEVNGEEVSRQIPPSEFLRILEKLKDLAEGNQPRGALVDLDV